MRKELVVETLSLLFTLLLLSSYFITLKTISRDRKTEKGVVEQYCHTVHRYSVDNYLTCKEKDSQEILIELSDTAQNKISKVSKEELIEATSRDTK